VARSYILSTNSRIRISGLVGAIGSVLFFCIFVILGFLQPGYNHVRNTVSVLVHGPYGWIQSVNFVILAVAFLSLSYGLIKTIGDKYQKPMRRTMLLCIIGMCIIMVFPADNMYTHTHATFLTMSPIARIHYIVTLGLIFSFAATMHYITNGMETVAQWKTFVPYSRVSLQCTCVSGIAWYLLNEIGLIFPIKGLLQKVIIAIVLLWMFRAGIRLYRFRQPRF